MVINIGIGESPRKSRQLILPGGSGHRVYLAYCPPLRDRSFITGRGGGFEFEMNKSRALNICTPPQSRQGQAFSSPAPFKGRKLAYTPLSMTKTSGVNIKTTPKPVVSPALLHGQYFVQVSFFKTKLALPLPYVLYPSSP